MLTYTLISKIYVVHGPTLRMAAEVCTEQLEGQDESFQLIFQCHSLRIFMDALYVEKENRYSFFLARIA